MRTYNNTRGPRSAREAQVVLDLHGRTGATTVDSEILEAYGDRIKSDSALGWGVPRDRHQLPPDRPSNKETGGRERPLFTAIYFPRLIKNRGRGLPPALATAAAARHTRTGAGSGGPPGHAAALFSAVHENPPFRDDPKMDYVKVLQKQAKPDLKTSRQKRSRMARYGLVSDPL